MAEEYSADMLEKLNYLEFMGQYSESQIRAGGRDLFNAVAHYIVKDPNVITDFDPMIVLSSALETQPEIDIELLKSIQRQMLESESLMNVIRGVTPAKPRAKERLTTLAWAINFGIAGKRSMMSK